MAGHGGKIPKETMANRLSGLWSRVNLTSDQVSLHELGGSDTTDEFLDWDTYDKGRYNTNSAPPPPVTAAVRGSAAKKKSERPKSFTYDSGDERTPKRKSKFQILPRKRESWHSSTTKMADAGTKKKKERLCNCCLKQPEKTEQGKAKVCWKGWGRLKTSRQNWLKPRWLFHFRNSGNATTARMKCANSATTEMADATNVT